MKAMEVVEEANRAAVESCKKLVAVLSLSGADAFRPLPVAAETDEAVARFGKVVAVLSDRLGHARARVAGKRSPPAPPVDASCLLEYHPSLAVAPRHTTNGGHLLVSATSPPPPPPPPPTTTTTTTSLLASMTMRSAAEPMTMRSQKAEVVAPAVLVSPPCASNVTLTPAPAKKFDRSMFLETSLLELNNSCSVPPSSSPAMAVQKSSPKVAAPNPCTSTPHIQLQPTTQFQPPPQQQAAKKQKSFQFDQTPSGEQFHIEVPVPLPRGAAPAAKEVISFSFDNNSVCTSSAATSFFTSISSQLISMSDAATSSAARPATAKKMCGKGVEDGGGGVRCHCPKKKKPREKRVVRVPAISDKNADIPADNYSWRKYGQKPIKGSPHPRGYYRCSSKKDCPARKHVERCRSDAAMLIVTYENDHNHAQPLDPSVLTAANAEP